MIDDQEHIQNYLIHQLIQASSDCILLLEATGKILFTNQAAQLIMQSETPNSSNEAYWEWLWENDMQASAHQALLLAAEGKTGAFQGYSSIPRDEKKWWNVSITRYNESPTRSQRLIAILQDDTIHHELQIEQEQMIEDLSEERRTLEQIIAHLPCGAIVAEASSGKVYLGNKRLEEIVRHPTHNATPTSEQKEWSGWHMNGQPIQPEEWPMTHALQGNITEEDIRYLRGDGTTCYIQLNGAPIKDAENQTIAGIVTFNDITHEKELEKQQEAFLSLATHELKSPLTAIQGFIQLAQRGLDRFKSLEKNDPEETQSIVNHISLILNRSLQQMRLQNRLINDILYMSRLRTEKLELSKEVWDIEYIVEEAVLDQQVINQDRKIEVEIPTEEQLLVYGDKDRIGQVINNYLTNALKYSPDDTTIHIGLKKHEQKAYVWVKDFGPGLSEEEQQHLWQRFYQVPGIQVQGSGATGIGLGLGLYICQQLITIHGGEVGVKSKPGQGSTFWFTLPLFQGN